MDVTDKKTALDDDSILYQKRDAQTNREAVKNLDRKGKFQFFIDYYLVRVVAVIAAIGIGGAIIYSIVFNHQDVLLSITMIGSTYMEDSEALAEDLRPALGLTKKNELVYITSYYLDDYNQQMTFATRTAARDVDIILCDPEQFERYAEQGLFADLSQVLPPDLYAAYEDQMVTGRVANYSSPTEIASYSEEFPMAIDISGNPVMANYSSYPATLYLTVCVGSQHQEQDVTFLEFLTNK